MHRDPSFRNPKTWSLAALLIAALAGCATVATVPAPPPTPTGDVVETLHGVEIADPYRWLEDQESPETRAWIETQNAYTDTVLDPLPGQQALRERFAELLKIDVVTTPTARGGRYFFSKRGADQDLYVIYVREGIDGEDRVLIDPHPLSEDHTVSVNLMDVSDDGTLLAYGVREGGQDEVTVRFHDVDRGQDLPDVLAKGRYFGVSIAQDKRTLYYTRHGEAGPRVYRHVVGDDPAKDRIVFGEGYGPDKILFAGLSENGRYLVAHVLYGSSADKTEIHVNDLRGKRGFRPVVTDVDARFFATVAGDTLVIRTNWQAENGRILAVAAGNPSRGAWREIVPEHDQRVMEGFSAVGGRLFVQYLDDVKSHLEAFDLAGNSIGAIRFDTLGTVGSVSGRWDADEAFFRFESFHVPDTVYRYVPSTGERQIWTQLDVPIDAERFEVKQVWFTSRDGTRVPMFLVHERGVALDGSNPTLLTGYGGFTASLTPSFSSSALVWAEQGGVYAVANLRGGGEFGEAWHRAGMRENKQNVFDDFIAAAEWLIDNKYTRPDKLAIRGGSNGGLLVGAVMNQRPELFGAVICSYPLLDMLRYHQFLVARYWVPEYGSSEDPEQFRYLKAYSPYHNVTPGTGYPAVLFISGDGDTRVAPLHARKMTALVQAANGGERPVLLRYHIKAGHSGGKPISQTIDDLTESYSFLLWQLGEL